MLDKDYQQAIMHAIAVHGLEITGYHVGAGKFRDLEIGLGESFETLTNFIGTLKANGIRNCQITRVTNDSHQKHGQPYVSIDSVWWDESLADDQQPGSSADCVGS